ncbi:MAG TPA: hypothetical protein VIY73_05510 [Polyangiaceae bacterium]
MTRTMAAPIERALWGSSEDPLLPSVREALAQVSPERGATTSELADLVGVVGAHEELTRIGMCARTLGWSPSQRRTRDAAGVPTRERRYFPHARDEQDADEGPVTEPRLDDVTGGLGGGPAPGRAGGRFGHPPATPEELLAAVAEAEGVAPVERAERRPPPPVETAFVPHCPMGPAPPGSEWRQLPNGTWLCAALRADVAPEQVVALVRRRGELLLELGRVDAEIARLQEARAR